MSLSSDALTARPADLRALMTSFGKLLDNDFIVGKQRFSIVVMEIFRSMCPKSVADDDVRVALYFNRVDELRNVSIIAAIEAIYKRTTPIVKTPSIPVLPAVAVASKTRSAPSRPSTGIPPAYDSTVSLRKLDSAGGVRSASTYRSLSKLLAVSATPSSKAGSDLTSRRWVLETRPNLHPSGVSLRYKLRK